MDFGVNLVSKWLKRSLGRCEVVDFSQVVDIGQVVDFVCQKSKIFDFFFGGPKWVSIWSGGDLGSLKMDLGHLWWILVSICSINR